MSQIPPIEIPPEALAAVQATSDRADAAHREAMRLAALNPRPDRATDRFEVIVDAATDVKVAHLQVATVVHDDYFADDERIDWTAFFDKLEDVFGIGVVDDDCPAANKFRRHIADIRAAR